MERDSEYQSYYDKAESLRGKVVYGDANRESNSQCPVTTEEQDSIWAKAIDLLSRTFRNRSYCKGIYIAATDQVLKIMERCRLRLDDGNFPVFKTVFSNSDKTLVEFSDDAYRILGVEFVD
ncbi:MAG: hypothetical protein V1928_04420 [Parcubacteria group bacterium]